MEECIFYKEWLHLPKEQFNILAMIAVSGGEYQGSLASMCRFFGKDAQSNNREPIKEDIQFLNDENWIEYRQQSANKYNLKIIPKTKEIHLPLEWVISVIKHDYTGEPVASAQVIKVFMWIVDNDIEIITDLLIKNDLNVSGSTIGRAKKVLKFEYEIIKGKLVSKKCGEDTFIRIGQKLEACAWWQDIT